MVVITLNLTNIRQYKTSLWQINISSTINKIEHVELQIEIAATLSEGINIKLESPAGTVSELVKTEIVDVLGKKNKLKGGSSDYNRNSLGMMMVFSTVKMLDEGAAGQWKLYTTLTISSVICETRSM